MTFNQMVANEVVQQIKAAGFRPFLAASGTYGFYTDAEGSRVVSFQVDLGMVKVSGNYKTSWPSRTGTGWGLGGFNQTKIAEYFNSYPPRWAVGDATWKLTTLEEHLKTYQSSSKYVEIV